MASANAMVSDWYGIKSAFLPAVDAADVFIDFFFSDFLLYSASFKYSPLSSANAFMRHSVPSSPIGHRISNPDFEKVARAKGGWTNVWLDTRTAAKNATDDGGVPRATLLSFLVEIDAVDDDDDDAFSSLSSEGVILAVVILVIVGIVLFPPSLRLQEDDDDSNDSDDDNDDDGENIIVVVVIVIVVVSSKTPHAKKDTLLGVCTKNRRGGKREAFFLSLFFACFFLSVFF